MSRCFPDFDLDDLANRHAEEGEAAVVHEKVAEMAAPHALLALRAVQAKEEGNHLTCYASDAVCSNHLVGEPFVAASALVVLAARCCSHDAIVLVW